jgi:hypothetical protein
MLPVLLLGYFFREIGDFFRNILLIDMGSGLVGRIAIAGAIFNVLLNYMLIDGPLGLGIWGAAFATTLTWVAYCMTCWVAARKSHGVSFPVLPLTRMLALGGFVVFLHDVFHPANPYTCLVADLGWLTIFLIGAAVIYLEPAHRREAMGLALSALEAARRPRSVHVPGEY